MQAHPPVRDDDHMQHAVHVDELDQAGPAELVKSLSRSNSLPPGTGGRGDLRVRAWTAASSRRRSRSSAFRREAGISLSPEEPAHAAQR